MLKFWTKFGIVMGSCLVLSGCFDPTQEEILSKVEGVNSPEELIAAIGPANRVIDNGALKHWRYSASGGDVCFSVVGNLAMRMAC
ncbi:hypothetical protein A9Q83_06890 [Alphaproteobacteria bacterium 46_93_T64]|nr:hypothetical protein A9Q83_06890 [Alphaproteobacteria bacterium 46_93_T64]